MNRSRKRSSRQGKPGRVANQEDKCRDRLTNKLATAPREPPADRGACERQSTTQGSE